MTFWTVVLLIVGMALLIKGADFFVDGASSIAKALKVPTLIIGLTLVSIGTSLPEASVSINSSLVNMNDMSVGNVVGSNIFNTLLILGLSSVLIVLAIDSDMKKFDIPIMVGVYSLTILFSFVITPNVLDVWEGIIFLAIFITYLVFLVLRAKKQSLPKEQEEIKNKPIWLSIILVIVGGAGIIFGGDLVVNNAATMAKALGMSEALVGLTIVSVGTSLPELVTSVVAAIKKENDIAIGNIVGSNIFNMVFILGMSATISPILVSNSTLIDMLVMLATGIFTAIISFTCKKMHKWQGVVMMLAYAGYLAYIIIRN